MNEPQEHPWAKARRLCKELSDVLAEVENAWYCVVRAAGTENALAAVAMDDKEAAPEIPVDRVNRLGWELAAALNDYGDGEFHAYVVPAKRGGYCVMFAHRPNRLPEPFHDRL
ncbi:hypothetical protein [Rhizobium alvei]|uniref:Uncharacterized protein n=1 Tax=Rhizobium alvei TaxID=1132659 RepID=A0ABT8YL24_9HYPH|nr:hypothetical protein [Rhizobium alvei]MDO6963999.1 hypothetical protein [Rhizobium alvei]